MEPVLMVGQVPLAVGRFGGTLPEPWATTVPLLDPALLDEPPFELEDPEPLDVPLDPLLDPPPEEPSPPELVTPDPVPELDVAPLELVPPVVPFSPGPLLLEPGSVPLAVPLLAPLPK
jgi:hypothetical protein